MTWHWSFIKWQDNKKRIEWKVYELECNGLHWSKIQWIETDQGNKEYDEEYLEYLPQLSSPWRIIMVVHVSEEYVSARAKHVHNPHK